jgi:hypothetical protein
MKVRIKLQENKSCPSQTLKDSDVDEKSKHESQTEGDKEQSHVQAVVIILEELRLAPLPSFL